MHLYDAWAPMKEEHLLETELHCAGNYEELSLELTQRNLSHFKNHLAYHKGYIPDTLTNSLNEDDVVAWLHVDLNAAQPTIDTLNYFYPHIPKGGVILLDDYGWEDFKDTGKLLDIFFESKQGELFIMPTGQAIFFKS